MRGLRGQSALVVGVPMFVLLLAIGGVGELQRETEHAERLSDLSEARQFTSERLLLRLVDAETGIRGYAATRDRRFLEPYVNAAAELPQLTATMRGENMRVPVQIRAASASIARTAGDEMALLARIAGRLDHGELATVPSLLLHGKAGMDAIRLSIARLQAMERLINVERRRRANQDESALALGLDGIFVLTIVGGIGAIVTFTNRVVRRLRAVIEKTGQIATGAPLGAPLSGYDEIVLLDRAVHRMAAALATHERDIVTANRALDDRNAELHTAYQELEQFSYSVSHDLRAPVRTIGSFSHRLGLGYADRLDAEGRRLLRVVESEAGRLGRLIDELLEFSRLGRQQISLLPIAMTALVREVADMAQAATAHDVVITTHDLPDALGDRVLVRQVWENLISNAIKYSSTRAQSRVVIAGSTAGGIATYQVCDNGVGFDMKYAGKLFNVFERLHRGDEFEGTGVGLAIVRRIVERLGGTVWASAELGSGATFSFSLPRSSPS
jgi:signal transduction histidine kinase